jgi:hypothetical protein
MKVGFDAAAPEAKVFKDWLTERYHAPSDDAHQPVDLSAAAGFEEVMRGLTVQIANDPRRPAPRGSRTVFSGDSPIARI